MEEESPIQKNSAKNSNTSQLTSEKLKKINTINHTEFKNLNLQEIKALMSEKPAIVDGRRILDPRKAEDLGFTYYGVGFPVCMTKTSAKRH